MFYKRVPFVLLEEVKSVVIDFYNNLARESPHKKASVLINKTRTQVRYLENSLATCFKKFKDAYPNIRLSQSAFESVRPKNIKLLSQATLKFPVVKLTLISTI